MATTKKATSKTTARKAAAPKKPAAKSASVKKQSATTKASKSSAKQMQSFRVSPEPTPFTTFKITRQTVYWVVLVAFIIFIQLWIIKLQVEVAAVIDEQQASTLIGE